MKVASIQLWPDEADALETMRSAGHFRSDEEVLRSALGLLAETMDAEIPATRDTFQLGRVTRSSAGEQMALFDGGTDNGETVGNPSTTGVHGSVPDGD